MVTVRLPKQVAIANDRLAALHFSIVLALLAGLLYYNFWTGTEYAKSIPISTSLQIHWDEEATVQGMENFFEGDAAWQQLCAGFTRNGLVEQEKWGYMWDTEKVCTSLCTLDDLFSFSTWPDPEDAELKTTGRPSCWSEFKTFGIGKNYTALQLTESASQRDLHLITAKKDWIVNHQNRTRTQYIELAPHGKAALIAFRYIYALEDRAPWFLMNGQNRPEFVRGANTNTKTVIVDARGDPVGEPIPPGAPLQFTVDQVMSWAKGDGEDGGPVEQADLITGAEINIKAHCLGSDLDIRQWLAELRQSEESDESRSQAYAYGASLQEPVCFLRFMKVSNTYKVNVAYAANPNWSDGAAIEVMTETSGFFFKAGAGDGSILVYDLHTIMINITSMLVMLALPMRLTSFIAVWMLGPISQMYRRIVYEPYDIELQAAGAGTVLAANTDVFNKHKCLGEDGREVFDLLAMQSLLRKAMASREHALDKKEIASLSHFLYAGIRRLQVGDNDRGVLATLCEGILDISSASRRDASRGEDQSGGGITLDQWSQARLELEKITFDALVQLFDKDRPRSLFERFFTPPGIRHALVQAMDAEERSEYKRHTPAAVVKRGVGWVGKRLSGSPARSSASGDHRSRRTPKTGASTDMIDRIATYVEAEDLSEQKRRTAGGAVQRGADWAGKKLSGSPARASKTTPPRLEIATGVSTGLFDTITAYDASDEIPAVGRGRAADERAPPMLDDLRRELERLSQRLLEAERRVLQEARPSLMGADIDDACSMPSQPSMVEIIIEPVRADETEKVVRGESSCQELGRRLSNLEASLQALQANCNAESSLAPAASVTSRRSEHRSQRINNAWAKAVIESFGEAVVPPLEQPRGRISRRTRSR